MENSTSINAETQFRAFFEDVINQGKFDRLNDLVSFEFIEHEEFPGLEPGREGLRQFFTMLRTAFPDLNVKIEFMLGDIDNDRLIAYAVMTGTHEGDFMGLAPTGKKINVKEIDIVRMQDGKMCEHWGIADTMTMMQQLGAIPEDA